MSEKEPKRICKGICKQYRAERPVDGKRYASGQVRCQTCEIYLTRDGCKDKFGNSVDARTKDLHCKCCNMRVRSKPRGSKYKEQYHEDVNKWDADELINFISEESRPQANYQFILIKTLLENNNAVTKDVLVEELEFYNQDKPSQDYRKNVVFSVLQGHRLIVEEDGFYKLNVDELTPFDTLEIISLCNQKIYQNKISDNKEYFIANGPWKNWNHTIENLPLRWGVAATTPSNVAVYNLLKEGDLVYYYSTKDEPVHFSKRGFFGIGVVKKKVVDTSERYWPEEKQSDQTFYAHKLYLDTIKFVHTDDELLPIVEGLPFVKGLNHITSGEPLEKLIQSTKDDWMLFEEGKDPTKYWKIAPGTSAEYWDAQKDSGLIGIGWNELGDLTGKKFEEVHEKLKSLWPSQIAVFSPQFRDFMSIKPGDIVIANKGLSKVVGIGEVTGDYQYREDLPYHHTYPVEWFDTETKDIPDQGVTWRKTVFQVSENLYDSILSGSFPKAGKFPAELERLIMEFDTNRQLFNPDYEGKSKADEERKKFLEIYPEEKIPELKLEEYVLGQDPNATSPEKRFSYMLESELDSLGSIWGSYSTKFGVFFSNSRNDYWYDKSKHPSLEKAFDSVKDDISFVIIAAKKFSEDGNWEKLSDAIDNRKFTITRNLISKIIAVYYPENWITVHSETHIDRILDYLKIPRKDINNKLIMKKARLMELKNSHNIMKNWDNLDYSHFLWQAIAEKDNSAPPESNAPQSDFPSDDPPEFEPAESNYLLVRHTPSFKRKKADTHYWKDKLGKEYQFGNSIPNSKKILPNSKTVWYYTDKENLYFWGFGIVEDVNPQEDGLSVAKMKNFHYFDKQFDPESNLEPSAIKSIYSIQQQIKQLPSWNPFNSIIEINEHIYDQILESENLETTFIDDDLPYPEESIDEAKKEIHNEILISEDVLNQIISTLLSGKNILLTGPVGSGKTHLSKLLPRKIWKEFGGYYPQVYTATADWTTQDVVGGIFPKISDDDQIMYEIQRGCVAETVAQNWLNENSDSKKRIHVEKEIDGKVQRFRGIWLTIDEFNRANIDRAFGPLFTALEYNNLQIPTTEKEMPYDILQIPKDYRIIGTLNTADKHYLHTLSDALKRRFAIIELPVPTYEQKQQELFFVVKKSLENLGNDKISTSLKVEDGAIVSGSDSEAEQILEKLYLLMAYIREIKPLGTALMISMFRFMITNHKLTKDWDKSMDMALTSNLLPQLENLPYWSLKVIKSVFDQDPGNFFKTDSEIKKDGSENYRIDFEHLYRFLKKIKPMSKTILKRFKEGSLNDEDFKSLNPWVEISKPKLPIFNETITRLIEDKGFTEESEDASENE